MSKEREITTLQRQLRIGATVLPDPAPDKPAEEAFRMYSGTYAFLEVATIRQVGVEGDIMVYEAEKPPAQTKG
jgi:hypothetical protein